jgi:RimJ/RimL family protein N-acetyltransferase
VVGGQELFVRPFQIGEVEAYLQHVAEVDADSGIDGAPHSHPYSASDAFDFETGRNREVERWTTPVTHVGWRRAWGVFDRDDLVGHLYLAGGPLQTGLHRADLGMGVLPSHRRRRGATRLLDTAIAWARHDPGICWIDLNVFADNPGAQHLYERFGFATIGRTSDRFRVDGASLDDIAMTLNVATAR